MGNIGKFAIVSLVSVSVFAWVIQQEPVAGWLEAPSPSETAKVIQEVADILVQLGEEKALTDQAKYRLAKKAVRKLASVKDAPDLPLGADALRTEVEGLAKALHAPYCAAVLEHAKKVEKDGLVDGALSLVAEAKKESCPPEAWTQLAASARLQRAENRFAEAKRKVRARAWLKADELFLKAVVDANELASDSPQAAARLHARIVKAQNRITQEVIRAREIALRCGDEPSGPDSLVHFYLKYGGGRDYMHDAGSIRVLGCNRAKVRKRDCWTTVCRIRGKNAFGMNTVSRMRFSFVGIGDGKYIVTSAKQL